MNKNLQMTIYRDGLETGSLVLKTPGQYYKISGLTQVLRLKGDIEQFIRQVVAGATPNSPLDIADTSGKAYKIELYFKAEILVLKLWLKTADGGQMLMFWWEGGFGEFRDGFKAF